ncbi:P5I11 protein, partial [Polypterus senegalus]|nr:P5I11 protein [Polypterus senegalus]
MASKPHPPLMKKHSQTDLVSRLKTRKILGVGGEDDDGEVHRSKISQVLGNEIKFSVREPLGLRVWLLISAVMFTVVALMVGISLIMWNGLYTAEKVIIRWTLLTEACYFGIQFIVTAITLVENGSVSNGALLLISSRVLFIIISLSYYYQLGRRPKKI